VTVADPATLPRRSFVYRRLVERGASFDATGHAVRTGENAVNPGVVLCDLSLAPRCGFKGRQALDWLRDQGIVVSDENNRAMRLGASGLTCRLGDGEALVMAPPDAVERLDIERLEAACAHDAPVGCFAMPRADSHFWYRIAGRDAARLLARLCGVDFRAHRFDQLEIAQTIVARVSAIVVRDDIGETLAYHLLADSASALYLWDCVVAAMADFDGEIVGIEMLGENQ
jgi:sarcosine oxidase, subunit gamma